MRCGILFVLGAVAACAQPVSVGVKGGVPLIAPLHSEGPIYQAGIRRYVVGPSLEIRLPWRLAVAVDALYKRMSYDFWIFSPSVSGTSFLVSGSTRAGRWEFPLMLKRRFGAGRVNPFAGAGVALNRVAGIRTDADYCTRGLFDREFRCSRGSSERAFELRHRQALGVAAGGGIEFRLWRLRMAPEIRYTHWGDRNFGVRDAPLRSNLNQVDFLLGLGF